VLLLLTRQISPWGLIKYISIYLSIYDFTFHSMAKRWELRNCTCASGLRPHAGFCVCECAEGLVLRTELHWWLSPWCHFNNSAISLRSNEITFLFFKACLQKSLLENNTGAQPPTVFLVETNMHGWRGEADVQLSVQLNRGPVRTHWFCHAPWIMGLKRKSLIPHRPISSGGKNNNTSLN